MTSLRRQRRARRFSAEVETAQAVLETAGVQIGLVVGHQPTAKPWPWALGFYASIPAGATRNVRWVTWRAAEVIDPASDPVSDAAITVALAIACVSPVAWEA